MTSVQVNKSVCFSCEAGLANSAIIAAGHSGLVTHRWWGSKFCKRRCKEAHIREIMLDRRAIHRWCGLLARISLGRQAIPMVPRFAWNCARGLRTSECVPSLSCHFLSRCQTRKPGIAVGRSTSKVPAFAGRTHVRAERARRIATRFVLPMAISFTKR